MDENFEAETEEVGLTGVEKAGNKNTDEEFASEAVVGFAPGQKKRFLGEDEFWNPVSNPGIMSSSNMDVRLEDKSKEMLPQIGERGHISKQTREKEQAGQEGDPEMWPNSIPGKRIPYIKSPRQGEKHQDQTFESTNQELAGNSLTPRNGSPNQEQKKPMDHTQQRRSYSFDSYTPKSRYYDLQLAREALSYKLTTPLPQTVNYSYKKKPRRPKSYRQNNKKSFVYQPSSNGYQGLYPPLSYAQPSHQCKTKVSSHF